MYDELVKRLKYCRNNAAVITDDELMAIADQAADAIEKLTAIREEQKAQIIAMAAEDKPRWIPVTEALPKHAYGEGTSVLTVSSLGSMRVLYFDGGNWCYPTGEALTTARKYPITHWMPLPEPPKEET